jgi:hypothetical protein
MSPFLEWRSEIFFAPGANNRNGRPNQKLRIKKKSRLLVAIPSV